MSPGEVILRSSDGDDILVFILGQNKSKQAKKNFDPARPGLTLIKRLLLGRYGTEVAEILQVCSFT